MTQKIACTEGIVIQIYNQQLGMPKRSKYNFVTISLKANGKTYTSRNTVSVPGWVKIGAKLKVWYPLNDPKQVYRMPFIAWIRALVK